MDQRSGSCIAMMSPCNTILSAGRYTTRSPLVCAGAQWNTSTFTPLIFRLSLFLVTTRGKMIGRRRAAAASRQGSLLLLLVVLVGDDRDACREGGESIDVIAVAVVVMTVVIGFGVISAISASSSFPPGGGLRVDDDDAFVADDDTAVSASAFDPVDVRLQLMGVDGALRRAAAPMPKSKQWRRLSPVQREKSFWCAYAYGFSEKLITAGIREDEGSRGSLRT